MIESILIIILVSLLYLFFITNTQGLVYVNSNNKKYLVQNREDKQDSADTIYKIQNRIFKLFEILLMREDIPFSKQYIINANKKIKYTIFRESIENSKYTSYSVNKGEEIVLCLRSLNTGRIHNIDVLMYVTIHEIAHVICPEIGHTKLFHDIFYYILNIAREHNIYKYTNYNEDNVEYCGIVISNNILNA